MQPVPHGGTLPGRPSRDAVTTAACGQFFTEGPQDFRYTFCDDLEAHGYGCLCAAPAIDMSRMPPLPSVPVGLYWPEPESGDEDGNRR